MRISTIDTIRKSALIVGPLLLMASLSSLQAVGSPATEEMAEQIAVVTDSPKPVGIRDYEILLRTDLENDRLVLQTTCALRNSGPKPLEQVDFDLMARRQFYGVKVEIAEIVRLTNGKPVPVEFTHGSLKTPTDPAQEGSEQYPQLVRVKLSPVLGMDEECRLKFDYSIIHLDPKRSDLNYRIVALLPDGSKEVCLLYDFSWIPSVTWADENVRDLPRSRNFFPKGLKPTWRITLIHPSSYESLVVDGRLESSERAEKETISRYVSVTGSRPQLLIGNSEKVKVEDGGAAVIFLLPKKQYERDVVEAVGKFLIRAYRFYTDLFGALEPKDIHVAVSSADMGGHGAYLGMFLNADYFQTKRQPDELLPSRFFHSTGAHELAHSWWGDSVSSYGRGTKFLRESLAEFSAGHFGREVYGRKSLVSEDMLASLLRGETPGCLFYPTADSQTRAYSKGTRVVDILREEMGPDTFDCVLRTFATMYKGSYVTFVDFVTVCNEVSQRDWLPFFNFWCYGTGYPAYRLTGFVSNPAQDGWETKVTIRNNGKGMMHCPLELRMATGTKRERFALPEGEERTFPYQTAAKVDQVIIDPELTAYQVDVTDVADLLRIEAATKESQWEWLHYWLGVAFGKQNRNEDAMKHIAFAVAVHERGGGKGKANPAFYFSRGIVSLHQGERTKADEDVRLFLRGIFSWGAQGGLEHVMGSLRYARLISGKDEEKQLQRMLELLTGKDIPLDPRLREWNKWWTAHQEGFQLGPTAIRLTPGGLRMSNGTQE